MVKYSHLSDLSSLAEVVTPLRFHPDAFIRSSVLFAYFSIACAVPDSVFVEFFGSAVRGWIEWTLACADDVDAAEQQRNMDRSVASVFVEFFGSVVRGWIEWALGCADDVDAAEQQRNMAKSVASVLLQKVEGTAAIEESSSMPRLIR
ncbi:hypothetical protein Y032_0272g958 [Ancylostoma ceylanicum]|uniref:Uncharacterized protein n=1 Tax=Ancylostoma ceylanicum TaxID=53326 RepID=A0A016S8U4_9BILA|nr:hypothetical protein Y032_0272g958 [Ancylostoma ceylanicum]